MASVTNRVEGAEELAKALRQLPVRARKKHLRRGLRRGITLIRDEIRATAPVRPPQMPSSHKPGLLRRAIRVRPRRARSGYIKVSLYYPRHGRTTGNKTSAGRYDPKDPFYWRFVVDGTRFMAANDYITRSADTRFSQVISRVTKEMRASVEEEMAKLRRAT